jgi:hypothetical protein
MMRIMQLDFETQEMISQMALSRAPALRERDGETIRKIESAPALMMYST